MIGGTRFMGYHLTRRLLADGHDLTLYNRGVSTDDFGDRVKRVKGDRYDLKAFAASLRTAHST